jgi:SAM-dependent methyltransferase
MKGNSWKAQGLAILDYFKGNHNATFIAHSDDGDRDEVEASLFFRRYEDSPQIEKMAIDLCYGRVLDIGAGAGCHTLELQNRGIDVTAIDISPEAVEVMVKRGVKNAICIDYREMKEGNFDTLLLMMNGIGVVGDLAGLESFLRQAKLLTTRRGQIVFDSLDLLDNDYRTVENPTTNKIFPDRDVERIKSIGQLEYIFEYKETFYTTFNWLFIDSKQLSEYAQKTGWYSETLLMQEDGRYLARLSRRR